MIRPVDFKFNEQTAGNNKFQHASEQSDVQAKALTEFDNFATVLKENLVEVIVVNDTLSPETPDSIFPNNWVSFHSNGKVFLYPMFSKNRRLERRTDILDLLKSKFIIESITDLSIYENDNKYLEGTGSMVLDRDNKTAYACLSVRTDEKVLADFCNRSGYSSIVFKALDEAGFSIYHTNVMMCVGDRFAVICMDAIPDIADRAKVQEQLSVNGKEIITITLEQMNHFAGNMLQVRNSLSESLLVMSEQAYLSLSKTQILALQKYCKLVYSPLYTIETNGGGSARCMLAEIHLPER